jgi:hypothetical protein
MPILTGNKFGPQICHPTPQLHLQGQGITENVVHRYAPARFDTLHEVAEALLHAAEPQQFYLSQTDGELWPAPHVLKVAQLPVHFVLADGGPADRKPFVTKHAMLRFQHPPSSFNSRTPIPLAFFSPLSLCLSHSPSIWVPVRLCHFPSIPLCSSCTGPGISANSRSGPNLKESNLQVSPLTWSAPCRTC